MNTLSQGEKKLSELIACLGQKKEMNEAQTRFHLIDKVLFECLNWSRDEISVETYEDGGFCDYEFCTESRIAILEAKREGKYFELPVEENTKLLIDLRSLMMMGSDVKKAIEQVREYCSNRGVAVALISNGHQYIAFLASRMDGKTVLDGNAVVFRSLTHLRDNLPRAWNLLSSQGLKERNIIGYLSSNDNSLPNKISTKLATYSKIRYRNEFQGDLKILSQLFVQDIAEQKQIEKLFFAECYCDAGPISQHAMLTKKILNSRYASLFSENESHPNIISVKEKNIDNLNPRLLGQAIAKRPIVLLGDVGVGKTSFVKNLKFNSAYEEFKKAIYLNIDLGSNAALSSNLKVFILNDIIRQLNDVYNFNINNRENIKKIYKAEIERFEEGIWGLKKDRDANLYYTKLFEEIDKHIGEKDTHARKALAFFSKINNKQIIVSIDNADQRSFEIQQEAFIIAEEIAREWESAVFISVRPQTFFNSKRSGSLTAYPTNIFTISPPRIDEMIEKRLKFALSLAEGKQPIDTSGFLKIETNGLAQFIKVLLYSLTNNKDLCEFLENITGGNIRAVIEFISNFICSPNIDAAKIIKIMNEQGKYVIPLHEFTKSALLGEYSHFNPDNSLAMNIYDVSAHSMEHFLTPILLSFLEKTGDHKNHDGFCDRGIVLIELQNYGFNENQIESALKRTTNKKLIETSQRVTFEEDVHGNLIGKMPDSFRITSVGMYHLKRWHCSFTYLDAMVFDTPIFNEEIRSKICIKVDSFSIEDRYERTCLFKVYLKNCWNEYHQKPVYYNFLEYVKDSENSFSEVKAVLGRLPHKS